MKGGPEIPDGRRLKYPPAGDRNMHPTRPRTSNHCFSSSRPTASLAGLVDYDDFRQGLPLRDLRRTEGGSQQSVIPSRRKILCAEKEGGSRQSVILAHDEEARTTVLGFLSWRYEVLRPRSERGVVLGGVGVQDMGNPDQKPKQMHACEPPCWDKQVALAVDVVREAVLMLGSAGSCTAKAVAGNLASMSPAYSRLASGLSLQDVLALVLVPLLPSFPLRIAPPPACKSCVLLLNLVASRPLAPIQHSEPFRAQHEPRPLIHP